MDTASDCSVHNSVGTASDFSVQISVDGRTSSQKIRPFATTTVVPVSAAVLNTLEVLTTAMLVVALSADAPTRLCVAAALIDAVALRLAAASKTICPASAKLLAALSAAAPLV